MWLIVGIVVLAAAASSSRRDGERPSGEPAPSGIPAAARSGEGSSLVPPSLACPRLAIVENAWQWGGGVPFAAPRPDGGARFHAPHSLWLQLSRPGVDPDADRSPRGGEDRDRRVGVNLRLHFEGSREEVRVAGRERTPTLHHYLVGNDPSRWRTGVPGFGKVAYEGLYEGVDLLVREEGTVLEYDLVLSPGADLSSVVVRVEGADAPLRLDAEGALLIDTPLGAVRQPRPHAWEEEVGGRRTLECSYRIVGNDRFGFEVRGGREGCAIVVDPQLVFSTYLGGGGTETGYALALDPTGAAVVAGWTYSLDFPTTPGAFDTVNDSDAFVCRFPLSGAPPYYSTFLGGDEYDVALAIALDAAGNAVVAGYTNSPDFPTTPGAASTVLTGASSDAFVTRLPALGGPPSYSTFLGGSAFDAAYALALDAAGAAVVVGSTASSSFPLTPGAFDTSFNGGMLVLGAGEGFVTRVPLSGGPLAYSTFLGGVEDDQVTDVRIDASGAAVVVGKTISPDLPVTPGAFDTTHNQNSDAFVARLPLAGGPAPYVTYLGGAAQDQAQSVVLDASGAAVVAGFAASADFPATPGAFDVTPNGGTDAFVARLSFATGTLSYATFLGGGGADLVRGLALDATGAAVLMGYTNSAGFPTTSGAFDAGWNGGYDAFVARLVLSGAPPTYSSYLGGSGDEYGYAFGLDPMGRAVVAGNTDSIDFPLTVGAVDATLGGSTDAFVSQLALLPAGATTYGTSTPGCAGPLPIGVNSIPQVGNAAFSVTCGRAPANGLGALGLSATALATPVTILGAQSWIDWSASVSFALREFADASGVVQVPLPIPPVPSLAGAQVHLQFVWAGPSAPPPCPVTGISASNALAVVVQP